MTFYAEPNHINYDKWFDENIDPLDLANYINDTEFTESVNNKLYKHSSNNLIIGSSNNF